ncbi:DEAD/DEAH box helicase [Lachnobacterium bovis]|uniref:DEAD/DEAH box helicase n=1 Tax=Lachnobacterium bovis TaxID=140626 RepID=UPI0003B7A10B|nr:SNF2 helicase associated domain-containing protein [Lachnobacterium bovis]
MKNAKGDRIFPFKKGEKIKGDIQGLENYTYFDMNKISSNVNLYEEEFAKAKDLIKEGYVSIKKANFDYYSIWGKKLVGRVTVSIFKEPFTGEVSVDFDNEKILTIFYKGQAKTRSYDSSNRYGSKDMQKEEIAALILIDEYLKNNNPGDATDITASKLMENVRKTTRLIPERVEDNQQSFSSTIIDFIPKIELEYGTNKFPEVSFKICINNKKKYVIKNLFSLYKEIEKNGTYAFGKNFIVDFKYARFTQKALLVNKLIKKYVKENDIFNVDGYLQSKISLAKIELRGSYLDDFFEIFNGDKIEFKEKSYGYEDIFDNVERRSYDVVVLEDYEMEVKLLIEPVFSQKSGQTSETMSFEGVSVKAKVPKLLQGIDYAYYIYDGRFRRITIENSKKISPLVDVSRGNSEISFNVGRRNLSEFFRTILPTMGVKYEISDEVDELINNYMPPEAIFKFYVDSVDGNIVCDAKVFYGDRSFDLADANKDDFKYEIIREVKKEKYINDEVLRVFSGFNEETNQYDCFNDEDKIYSFMESGMNFLLTLGEVHVTDNLRAIKLKRRVSLMMGVSVKADLLNIEIISDDVRYDELLDILSSYRQKKKYFRLKNGSYIDLKDDNIKALDELIDTLSISDEQLKEKAINVPIYRALYLDRVLEENEGIYTKRDQTYKKLIKEFKAIKESDFDLPNSLNKIMRNYQKVGYKWLRTIDYYGFGGILADDMGLGKTIQAISVLLAAKEENKEGCSIVIAPSSLIYNWKEEINHFAPSLLVEIITGNKIQREELLEKCYKECDVIITSYDILKRDIVFYQDKSFNYQFIDEAQYIKNHTTETAKAVKVINSKTRYALTGTPIENRLSELWSIFDYLMPGFLYDYDKFRNDIEYSITKDNDEDSSNRLRRMVSPFILRRLKKQVLKDLPEKIEEISYTSFEKQQRQVYDGQLVKIKNMLEGADNNAYNKNKIALLAELTIMREICCDPKLVFDDYKGESAKKIACMELVNNAIEGGHRCLIFSQFTSMLALIEEELNKQKIEYYKITGKTPKDKRIEYVKEFNSNQVPVFLISLTAGGTGLNLTGADVVIHYDPWWNLAVQNQATDRAYRIGQKKAVTVYKLIVKGSIEEKILKLQEKKKDLSDSILSGENGTLGSLSKDELLELLRDS